MTWLHDEDGCCCGYDGPDEFGNYDLMVDPNCPLHAGTASTEERETAE